MSVTVEVTLRVREDTSVSYTQDTIAQVQLTEQLVLEHEGPKATMDDTLDIDAFTRRVMKDAGDKISVQLSAHARKLRKIEEARQEVEA